MGKRKKRKRVVPRDPAEIRTEPDLKTEADTIKALPPFKNILLPCLLVFIICFLVYSNTLKADFIWDDEYLILNNSQIQSFSHLWNTFKTYVGYGSENINNFYRPVQEISNMIDFHIWGKNPFGFHLTNVLLHSFVSVLAFIVMLHLTGDTAASLLGSLFYAVHPVHTEAVAYIAGRADPLYAFFMLSSFIFFIHSVKDLGSSGRGNIIYYVVSLILFSLSLLSKEMVMTMPVLLFLYMFFFMRKTKNSHLYRSFKWRWVPYAAIVVTYGILRSTVLDFSDIAPGSPFNLIPLPYRMATFFRTVLSYFRLLILPVDLHMERTIGITKSFLEPDALFAVLAMYGIFLAARKTYRSGKRCVSFGIVWFFVNIFPVSNIIPINSLIAEHWIYVPSLGIFMLLGIWLSGIWHNIHDNRITRKKTFTILVLIPLVACSFMTISRNFDWKNEISFFKSTLKYHPKNARLYLNLGNTFYEKKEIKNAIEQYLKAIEINDKYAPAYGNIGSAYLHEGDIEEAEKYLAKAIKYKDNYPIAHYNLGIVYAKREQYEKAREELEKATTQLPQLYQAWNLLVKVYLKNNMLEDAKRACRTSLSIMPDQPNMRSTLKKMENVGLRKTK